MGDTVFSQVLDRKRLRVTSKPTASARFSTPRNRRLPEFEGLTDEGDAAGASKQTLMVESGNSSLLIQNEPL